jgi:hypothetical protein
MSPPSKQATPPPSPPPPQCDQCGAPMKLDRVVPHPEKPGELHVYECTGCALPTVRYVPR